MDRASARALGLAVAVVAAVCAVCPSARAADWTVVPVLSLGIDNDTNRQLTSPAIPSRGFSMNIDTRFERDTERLKLSLRPYGQAERYSDHRLDPTNEEGIDATATWLATERSSFTLHTLLQDASTIYAEISGTGLYHLGQRRRDEDVDGSWSYQQTERWTFQLGGAYSTSNYTGFGTSPLSDYLQSSGNASESYAFTERFSVSLSASAGDARTRGFEQSTRFQSLGLGFQWQPFERLVLSGSGGASHQTTGSLQSTSLVGQVSLSYKEELGSISFSAQRQVEPTGYGIFTQVDQLSLALSRDIAPRLSLQSGAQMYRDTSAFNSPYISFTYADRTYSEAYLSLSRQQTEHWTVSVQVLYDRQDDPSSIFFPTALHASGWQASLQAVWTPLGLSLSR